MEGPAPNSARAFLLFIVLALLLLLLLLALIRTPLLPPPLLLLWALLADFPLGIWVGPRMDEDQGEKDRADDAAAA